MDLLIMFGFGFVCGILAAILVSAYYVYKHNKE